MLHKVPKEHARSQSVYFWYSPEGEWRSSEQGAGWNSLNQLLQEYEDEVLRLEKEYEAAHRAEDWFRILDEIVPIHRAARNMYDALQQARQGAMGTELRGNLQQLCDHASEIVRAAELLQIDSVHSMQFAIARQGERQSQFSQQQLQSAHRLNILAAVFLPVATISSVFGMNLASGLEATPLLFWGVLIIGLTVGGWIGAKVMRVRQWNPADW